MKIVTTENTIWIFWPEEKLYQRIPRASRKEQNIHPSVYLSDRLQDDQWHEYAYILWAPEDIIQRDGLRLNIHTNHAYDIHGVFTGIIVDGLQDAQWLVEFEKLEEAAK